MTSKKQIKDIVSFLSSVKGDFANVTSPPFLLAPQSVVEVPSCWTERPALFVAPAQEPKPQLRALAVLKWILCSLRRQLYVGYNPDSGIKKPLNAFLGELFFGSFQDGALTSNLISEQVSHHPPITASYVWNDELGIRAVGYSRVEMTFTNAINIKQRGHSLLHIDKFDEDYLIELPDAQVKGFISGKPYPELNGTYHAVSADFISEMKFSGQGLLSGERNSVEAKVYRRSDPNKTPIFSIEGQWSDKFTIYDGGNGKILDVWDPEENPVVPVDIDELEHQDPWESRKAWNEVFEAIKTGDMSAVIVEKSKLEDAQRNMRAAEPDHGASWTPLFFHIEEKLEPHVKELASIIDMPLQADKTKGIWRYNAAKSSQIPKPYHGNLTPFG